MELIHLQNLLSIGYLCIHIVGWIVWGTEVRRGIRAPTKKCWAEPRGSLSEALLTPVFWFSACGEHQGMGQRRDWGRDCGTLFGCRGGWDPSMNLPPFTRLQKSKFHGILCFSRKSTGNLRERSSRSPGSAHSLIQLLNLSAGTDSHLGVSPVSLFHRKEEVRPAHKVFQGQKWLFQEHQVRAF